MSLYDKCLSVVKSNENNADLLSTQNNILDIIKQPDIPLIDSYSGVIFYYISDIHLEHQISSAYPKGAKDVQVKEYVKKIVSDLLIDEIAIDCNEKFILFGGDIASEFQLSKLFFSNFINLWNEKSKADYEEKRALILPLCQEKKLIADQLSKWKNKHQWAYGIQHEDLLKYPDKRVPVIIKDLIIRHCELKRSIDETILFNGERYYLDKWHKPNKRICAILGNHEIWNFETLENCANTYRKLFENLGIAFLNNSGWYDSLNNLAIIGGIGFAGYDQCKNANYGIYRNLISREQEIALTKEWENYYHTSVLRAKNKNIFLIVLTHCPPYGWKSQKQLDSNCAYFYGHDHKSKLDYIEEKNTYVFADNQIGYKAIDFAFKKTTILAESNIFADYDDGIHTISPEDYYNFNRFKGIDINGIKTIDNRIKKGANLYMVKEKGYYCFFVVCKNKTPGSSVGTFICVGGVLKKLSDLTEIDYYKEKFFDMVNIYIDKLSPYRSAQERISKEVKAFGGDGTIHGYIIDIDFYNHIWLNPHDGKITFYHSPVFGLVEPYGTLRKLLAEHNPPLLKQFLAHTRMMTDKKGSLALKRGTLKTEFISLDIKNSLYPESKKMNQLQRIFEAKVLRDWNDGLLRLSKETISSKSIKALNDVRKIEN